MEPFTREKFQCLSEIIFNIFPYVNYVTLSNGTCCGKDNYFLQFRTSIGDLIKIDHQHFYFEEKQTDIIERNCIYLKNYGFLAKTKGLYCIERTSPTQDWEYNDSNVIIKFLPLFEELNIKNAIFNLTLGTLNTSNDVGYYQEFKFRSVPNILNGRFALDINTMKLYATLLIGE